MLNHPSLGEWLKHARRAAGLTQEGLATRAGLSARAISDLERNVNQAPRPGTLQLLLSALPLSAEEREQIQAAARADHEASPGRLEPAHLAPPGGRARELALGEGHLAGEGA